MKTMLALALTGTLAVLAMPLHAAKPAGKPFVKITAPKEGAKLDAMDQNKIAYEVSPGPRGDHVHAYVDGKEVAILRTLKGSYTLETLSPGKRNICVKVVNKGHTPIGVEQCVNVVVE